MPLFAFTGSRIMDAVRVFPVLALVGIASLVGCGDDDAPGDASTDSSDASGPPWVRVFDDLDAALICVLGTSDHDVWSVGGDDGQGPLVLHYDGTEWTRIPTGVRADLWWVHPFAGGPTYFGGSGGTIVRYENGVATKMTTPSSAGIVYGIWGTAPDDIWAVGGSGSTGGGFIWRYRGTEWTAMDLPFEISGQQVFKVHGTAANDVWLVGSGGLLVHSDGETLEMMLGPTTRTMFTVNARGDRVAMVGGFGSGELFEKNGEGGFESVVPMLAPTLIGIYLTDDGGYACGSSGTIVRRDPNAWVIERTGLESAEDLHTVWVDPSGGVWAVGGQVAAPPLVDGVMIHQGDEVPGGTFREE